MPDKEIIPAIYIPCFARKDALHRLCISLHQSILLHCEQHPDHNGHIELVFSVDHQAAPEVISYVKEFVWAFGPKAFVLHTERLGPDGNNLFCLSEAMKKGAIILLEEDTFVTHGFYEFACKALAFYNDENDIAGISLYNYEWNDEANLPFLKPQNGYDVYCFEKVSSRGLAVSRNMVKSFLQWKDEKAKPDFKTAFFRSI